MNYYEQHIGDYAKDAGHLSMLEDGAYRRLIDAYYTREKPLPADVRECCKLARASTKPERDAVSYVLREYFVLLDDGHHQKRCDQEIKRYQSKSAKARASAEARWGTSNSQSDGNANASADAMRTHSEGNAPRARPQSPVTSKEQKAPPASTPFQEPPAATPAPTVAGLACRLMREAGCRQTNPSHPDLLAALAEGVTPQALADTTGEAIAAGIVKPFGWAIQTARGRHAEGPRQLAMAQPTRNGQRPQPTSKTAQGFAALEGLKSANRRIANVDTGRDLDRLAEASLPRLGAPTGGRDD